MRFGFTACTLGSVDVSTLAWLSASICPFVFMFEGFAEALSTATATCNSWSLAVNVNNTSARWATRLSGDDWKVKRQRNLQLFQLGEWWSWRPSSLRCVGKKEQLKFLAWLCSFGRRSVARVIFVSFWCKHAGNNPRETVIWPINTFRPQHMCVGVTV